MSKNEDPLAVERAELLNVIEQLERLAAGLQDVNAEGSSTRTERLRRLRNQVESARSPAKRKIAWDVARIVMGELAVELIKWLTGSSNYIRTAVSLRRNSYATWRMHQVLTRSSRASAA